MDWIYLSEYPQKIFSRGAVFRTSARWPYEEKVDFMLMESKDSSSGFALWVSSGYKAGLPLIQLPEESLDGETRAISRAWIYENWNKWVYQDSSPDQVLVTENYKIE